MSAAAAAHEGKVYSDEGPRGAGFWAACRCGWKSPGGAGAKAKAEAALAEHLQGTTADRPARGLAVVSAAAPVRWSEAQTDIIRRIIAPDHNPNELAFFAEVCKHKGLDPFAGEICTWKAAGKVVIVETVAGLRAIAQRTGLYAGQDEPMWRAKGGPWVDTWDEDGPPHAAKIAVYRADWARPATGKAHYAEFVQLGRDGKPKDQWRTAPANQLAKCAERQAFIRAFSAQMAAAGINARDLSGPSRLSMEARRAGLDDDARHQLASRVSGGRTDSSRELTEDELLAARAEVATLIDDDTGYVDADGVIHVPDDPGPGSTPPDGGEAPATGAAPDPDLAALIVRLGEWNTAAAQEHRASLHQWMADRGIERGKPLKDYDRATLEAVAGEIDRRDRHGWPGEEPF